MNWRAWARNRLLNSAAVLEKLPVGNVFSAGSLNERPEQSPFIVLRFNERVEPPEGVPVDDMELIVFVHDLSESYERIDELLDAVRAELETDIAEEGGITVEWQGDSADLADDGYGTLTRNGSFRLLERRG